MNPRHPSDNADIAYGLQDMGSICYSVHTERSWGIRESLARCGRSFFGAARATRGPAPMPGKSSVILSTSLVPPADSTGLVDLEFRTH